MLRDFLTRSWPIGGLNRMAPQTCRCGYDRWRIWAIGWRGVRSHLSSDINSSS